jgi:hypothetical protein
MYERICMLLRDRPANAANAAAAHTLPHAGTANAANAGDAHTLPHAGAAHTLPHDDPGDTPHVGWQRYSHTATRG